MNKNLTVKELGVNGKFNFVNGISNIIMYIPYFYWLKQNAPT